MNDLTPALQLRTKFPDAEKIAETPPEKENPLHSPGMHRASRSAIALFSRSGGQQKTIAADTALHFPFRIFF